MPRAADVIAQAKPNRFDGQHGIFGLGEVLYGPFFDLAPRKDPWPAEIMSEYGKLATVAAIQFNPSMPQPIGISAHFSRPSGISSMASR